MSDKSTYSIIASSKLPLPALKVSVNFIGRKAVFFTAFLFLQFTFFANAQKDSIEDASNLSELSLEELMNIKIYSVSKTDESTFDAPIASTVVTREEIKKAGCTSIMEALRLVPGVIVREVSNGNYDIHIRGLDNVPPNLQTLYFFNSTALVMIDGRPVYNYLRGAVFWETLPIDLNDVEKIEVVRGPSAAMYGPNAVSGVINIITRKPEKKGLYANANAQYGNYNTAIANASVGYKFNDKFSAGVSGNFQNRDRTQSNYYSVAKDDYLPLDTFLRVIIKGKTPEQYDSIKNQAYPHPNLALRKYGYNAFLNYDINKRASIAVQGGAQVSEVQNIYVRDYLTTAQSSSYYANMKAKVYGINLQLSYLAGTEAPQKENKQWKWDFNNFDAVLDYNFTKVKHLTITPGVSYRRAIYDDRSYVNEALKEGFFNANLQVHNIAAFLRGDYTLFRDKLRLVAAGRVDGFNVPDKLYFSWQFAATYKVTPGHLIRIVESRANRAPLLFDMFLDFNSTAYNSATGQTTVSEFSGNKNLKLLSMDMLEIGYRGKLKDNLTLDIEVFGSSTKNYAKTILQGASYDSSSAVTTLQIQYQNLPVSAKELGGTISVNYVAGKFLFKPFITIQQTMLYDYSPYTAAPDVDTLYHNSYSPNPAKYNTQSGIGTKIKHTGTPAVYGGAYINYRITGHLNLNLNPYFMSPHTLLEIQNTYGEYNFTDGKQRGVENISPKFIMNVAVSYTLFKKLTLFMNFKNCISDKTREFYRGDIPGFKVSGGASVEF